MGMNHIRMGNSYWRMVVRYQVILNLEYVRGCLKELLFRTLKEEKKVNVKKEKRGEMIREDFGDRCRKVCEFSHVIWIERVGEGSQ